MNATTYFEVLAHTCALAGLGDPSTDELLDGTRTRLQRAIQRRVRQCWEMAWWPETMRSQERFYRADYVGATAYATDDEVYYPATGLYYRALSATTGNLPTNATYWTASPTDFDPYISLTQTGQDAIGKVRFVGLDDPLTDVDPRKVAWMIGANGIEALGTVVAASLYVWFQLRAPALKGGDFSATATYAAGDTIYYESTTAGYEGDYYTCLAATTAGQDPADTPAKWAKQEIPTAFVQAVAHYAAADHLRAEGSRETAILEEQAGDGALARAITSSGLHVATHAHFRAA